MHRLLPPALLLLASVAWGLYAIEHNRGHHRWAATWDDPATARRHESLWRFLPRLYERVMAPRLPQEPLAVTPSGRRPPETPPR